jgi:predicted nucleic acid-binding protein
LILVDTSVWADHLRTNDEGLVRLLDGGRVLSHPFVIGELAVGNLPQRALTLKRLQLLPRSEIATHQEVLDFIDRQALFGLGMGYVDAHLLAAVRLSRGVSLWTRDKRLFDAAARFGLAFATD